MSRTYFTAELDTAAVWWRIYRRDGVTLGFTTHDRDLMFGGILHRSAPGMVPSAIRQSVDFASDGTEVEGALTHRSIREEDLARGRYDGARIETGVIDWQTREHDCLFSGTIVAVSREDGRFSASIASAKAALDIVTVPQTSPTCRAAFGGAECGVNIAAHRTQAVVQEVDHDQGRIRCAAIGGPQWLNGVIRWLDGPLTGVEAGILDVEDGWMWLDRPLDKLCRSGDRVRLEHGCDRTIATCHARFANARNFRGEPHLPGNDLLTRTGGGL